MITTTNHSLEIEIVDKIKRIVAEHFGITVDDLVGSSRPERIAWPRQIAMMLARAED